MTKPTQEQIEIEKIAKIYSAVGLAPFLHERMRYQLGAKIDPKAYLHSFGLSPKNYLPFLQELSNRGINVEAEAQILGISLESLSTNRDSTKAPENIKNLNVTFENGDRVVILGFENDGGSQEGRFVAGYNPSSGKFAYASEKDHQAHGGLAGKVMPQYKIFEAGFMRVTPATKRISLFGDSDTFKTYPGQISLNLLERALTKWNILGRR